MIEWVKIGCYNRPAEWDETGADGVYGDVEDFIDSCNAGEQSLLYLLRHSAQGENLAKFTGPTEAAACEPSELPDLEPESQEENPLCDPPD